MGTSVAFSLCSAEESKHRSSSALFSASHCLLLYSVFSCVVLQFAEQFVLPHLCCQSSKVFCLFTWVFFSDSALIAWTIHRTLIWGFGAVPCSSNFNDAFRTFGKI